LIDSDTALSQILSCFKPMEMENDIQTLIMQRAHEEVLREILKDMEDENGKIKTYKGGRYERIEKESTKDDKEKEEEVESEDELEISPKWIDHGPKPRDLTTLVLNIFLHKINVGLSLESQTIMSLNGKYIYIVVRADEQDLKNIAEESHYTMQLAIGLTDLTSLEPCDMFYRPLRKCNTNIKEIEDLEDELKEYFAIVEGNVKELLKDQPLELNQKAEVKGDVNDRQWTTYYEYLKIIKEGYEDFKKFTFKRPHIKGVHLRNLAVNALKEANARTRSRAKLYNLWQRLGVPKEVGAYADYIDDPEKEYLWRKYIKDESLKRSIFRDLDRCRLTNVLINKVIHNKRLIKHGFLNCNFNFHNNFELFGTPRFEQVDDDPLEEKNEQELQARELFASEVPTGLKKKWRWILPPVTAIRNYFGEKIAFYVHYLNFYTIMLIFPGIIGIPAFILQTIFDHEGDGKEVYESTNSIFSLVVVVWAVVFYELWKRQEVKYSVMWGQNDYEEDQVERVDFNGIERRSPIDDQKDRYFSLFKRLFRIIFSIFVTFTLIGTVLAMIYGLFELRQFLFEEWEGKWYQSYVTTIVSTINAVQIFVFNYIYNFLAFILSKFENHKTETAFERSLITKTFFFQFVNSFNSLFYIAFIKRHEEG
jgi:hypothetical protein